MTGSGALTGRVALVTGATGVVGRRICAQLADAGARVVAQYRSSTAVSQAFVADSQHVAVHADFSTPGWQSLLSAAIEEVGGVDILVNTAHPASGSATISDLEPELLAAHLDAVTLHSELCQLVLPGMRARAWGRVVYLSGALVTRPADGRGAYAAAKAAATTLTRYVAWEEGRRGITANVVALGRIVDPTEPEPELSAEWADLAHTLMGRTAIGRFPTPDEAAYAVLSLVRPEASGITGQTVWVTGGEALA